MVLGVNVDGDTYSLTREFCEGLVQFGVAYVIEFQVVAKSIGERAG